MLMEAHFQVPSGLSPKTEGKCFLHSYVFHSAPYTSQNTKITLVEVNLGIGV